MSNLLTTLTVTAVAPFAFQGIGANDTDKLFQVNQPEVVAVQKLEPTKKTPKSEKKEKPVKKEAPKPTHKVYKVKEGDNLSVIADKHKISWVRIWQKNKQLQHQDQLKVGDKLKIPNKDEKLKDRSVVSPPVRASNPEVAQVTTSQPKTPQAAPQAVSAPSAVSRPDVGEHNGYAVGWCTWWVKEKRPEIGGFWGDAGYNWISAAQSAGFSTGSEPRAGAIGVQPGHVVYVESVSGSNVNISEMGWGYRANTVPNYRTVSASSFTYIY